MTLSGSLICLLLFTATLYATEPARAGSLLDLLGLPEGQRETQQRWLEAVPEIAREKRPEVVSELFWGILERSDRRRLKGPTRALALRYCLLGGPAACNEVEERAMAASESKEVLVGAALEYRIRLQIEAFPPTPLRQVLEARQELNPPNWIDIAPAWLRRGYLTYRAFFREASKFNESLPAPIYPFQLNSSVFFDRALDSMQGRTPPFQESFLAFHWGGSCGTGSGGFLRIRNRLLMLDWLRQGRAKLALSALVREWSHGGLDRDYAWQRRLLQKLGIDEEELLLGSLFANSLLFGPERLRFLPDPEGLLRRAIEATELPLSPREKASVLWKLAVLVAPSPAGTPIRRSGQRDSLLSAPVQLEILGLLGRNLWSAEEVARNAASSLLQLKREESVPLFWDLLQHPIRDLQESAHKTLVQMGHDPAPLPERARMEVQLLLDGRPIDPAAVEIGWLFGGPMQVIDGERVFQELPLDLAEDQPWKLTAVTSRLTSPTDVWFSIEEEIDRDSPPSAAFLEVETAPLSLHLDGIDELDPEGVIKLLLKRAWFYESGDVSWHEISRWMELAPAPTIFFPHLQPGGYRVQLLVPGFASVEETLELGADGAEILVPLQPGTDLTFRVAAPGGEQADPSPWVTLTDASGEVIHSTETRPYRFGNLAVGRYLLTVRSSESKRRQIEQGMGGPILTPPQFPLYQGYRQWIEIGTASAARIDLGVIRLEEMEEDESDQRSMDQDPVVKPPGDSESRFP